MLGNMLTKKRTFTIPAGLIYRYLWCIHPLRALGEAWLVGMLTLWGLSRIVGAVSPFVLANGILFLCALCGLWVAFRARIV